jgi:hypothetical protein
VHVDDEHEQERREEEDREHCAELEVQHEAVNRADSLALRAADLVMATDFSLFGPETHPCSYSVDIEGSFHGMVERPGE